MLTEIPAPPTPPAFGLSTAPIRAVALGAALLLGANSRDARADLAPLKLREGVNPLPAAPLDDLRVRMAEEEVELLVRRDGAGVDLLEVRARFVMENEGAAVRLATGFPAGEVVSIRSFEVEVEGAPLAFDLKDLEPGEAPIQRSPRARHDYWYVWEAEYPAGRSVHEVRYTVELARRETTTLGGYVLHTGAAWAGAIGRGTVTLRFGDGYSVEHLRDAKPYAFARREADRMIWSFEELEPLAEHDIDFRYAQRPWAEEHAALEERAATSWEARLDFAALWRERRRGHGRAEMDAVEREALRRALDGLLADAREEGPALVLPELDADGTIAPYATSAAPLLRAFEWAADLQAADPADGASRALLGRYVALLERYLGGELRVGDRVLEIGGSRPERTREHLERKLAAARAALGGEGT